MSHIYYNGEIHTFDDEEHVYEAVAVEGKEIVAVGSNEEILAYQTNETIVTDLQKQTMLPGFIDAHLHIFQLGFNLSYVDCKRQSIEEVVQAMKQRAKEINNNDEWIIGWGFDEALFEEGRNLNKWDFKDINNPVYISRYCLHAVFVNDIAIEKAGITKETEVKNGIIERDASGEATGIIKENAVQLVDDVMPAHTQEDMKKAIGLANDYLLKRGITSAHDAGLGFFVDPYKEFEVLWEMCQTGRLNVNMYVMILAEYFTAFMERYANSELNNLKIGAAKLFSDGTLSGRTAAVMTPYKHSEEKGMLQLSNEEMHEYVEIVHKMERQVAIHAIGDRAVNQVLQVYDAVQQDYPRENVRHRIEHATITTDALIQKMKENHVIPVPQPTLIHTAGDVHNAVLDTKDVHYFAYKTFMDQGLKPAGSSDAPIVDCSPLLGIYAAMTRESIHQNVWGEHERISLKQAVKMYTSYAAHAAYEEDIKGSIEVNKLADMVVLPEGFMNFSAQEVKDSSIKMTIINGEIMYEH